MAAVRRPGRLTDGDSKPPQKRIGAMGKTIFRAGRHRTITGQEVEFSEADLNAIAAAYDTAVHEAPLVIGHPKTVRPFIPVDRDGNLSPEAERGVLAAIYDHLAESV